MARHGLDIITRGLGGIYSMPSPLCFEASAIPRVEAFYGSFYCQMSGRTQAKTLMDGLEHLPAFHRINSLQVDSRVVSGDRWMQLK